MKSKKTVLIILLAFVLVLGGASMLYNRLMGMATNTDDEQLIRADFRRISGRWKELKAAHPELEGFRELSIGMSGDYRIALEYGATMVRIGTGIFGAREY